MDEERKSCKNCARHSPDRGLDGVPAICWHCIQDMSSPKWDHPNWVSKDPQKVSRSE